MAGGSPAEGKKKAMKENRNRFSEEETRVFAPSEKIGIVATIPQEGPPHITLLTSIMAASPDKAVIGEFCRGESKSNMVARPTVAFAVVTLDKRLWRGRARWTHLVKEGPEYDTYNNQPMFRYNTYFGINTVHCLDLIEIGGGTPLPMGTIVFSALLTKLAKNGAARPGTEPILTHFSESLFNRLDSLSFLSYIDDDGIPVIIPVVQCQAADSGRLAFHPGVFGKELSELTPGMSISVFCVSMQMESVLTCGVFEGFYRHRGIRLGLMDIGRVYNSMPSNHGWIYPEKPLEPVINF